MRARDRRPGDREASFHSTTTGGRRSGAGSSSPPLGLANCNALFSRLNEKARLAIVERAPLFRGVAPTHLGEIAGRAQERHFRRKDRLVEQGQRLDQLILLVEGRVKVTLLGVGGEEVILRLLGPGDVAAGLGPAPDTASPYSVEASEAGCALIWDRRSLEAISDRAAVVHRNALAIMGERLREMEDRYQELCTERVPFRLARMLLRLREEAPHPGGGPGVIALSQTDLAQMIGSSHFTVSRLLSQWESAGVLCTGRESIIIKDDSALLAVARDAEAPLLS